MGKEKGYDIKDPATAGAASISIWIRKCRNSDFGAAFWRNYIHTSIGRADLKQTSKGYEGLKATDVKGATRLRGGV